MGMIQAIPTGQFPESVVFPRGSEVALASDGKQSALFRTPKIYKPSQISDWRGEGRKPLPSWRHCWSGRVSTCAP
jgi:hypothetical protein